MQPWSTTKANQGRKRIQQPWRTQNYFHVVRIWWETEIEMAKTPVDPQLQKTKRGGHIRKSSNANLYLPIPIPTNTGVWGTWGEATVGYSILSRDPFFFVHAFIISSNYPMVCEWICGWNDRTPRCPALFERRSKGGGWDTTYLGSIKRTQASLHW